MKVRWLVVCVVVATVGSSGQALAKSGGGIPLPMPNPAGTDNHEPAARGALGTQGVRMVAPAPGPRAGTMRKTRPAPAPGTVPSKKKMSPANRRASQVAAKVKLFLQLLGEQAVKITGVRESSVLYEVTWTAKPKPAAKSAKPGPKTLKGKAWVSLDGRYFTRRAVDLGAALKGYRKQRTFVNCLKNKGLRVLLEPGTKGTAKQLKTLGVFGQDLVIWCPKKHKKLCDLHGAAYPRWLWSNGSQHGVMALSTFESQLGCKL